MRKKWVRKNSRVREKDHLIKDSKTLVSSHHFCNEGQQHLIRKREEEGERKKEIALLTGLGSKSRFQTLVHTHLLQHWSQTPFSQN